MRSGALEPYEESLADLGELSLVSSDGTVLALDVRRYVADVDAADETILDRCDGPTLDLGAGPGRMVRALAARGTVALGVDLAAAAVALSNDQGGTALLRDVFDRLPAEGRWSVALLVDGNIGIGGDVDRLLGRVATLLAPGGRLVAEVADDDELDAVWEARFARGGLVAGPRFPWAQVGAAALARRAARHGFRVAEDWTVDGRRLLSLRRAAPPGR